MLELISMGNQEKEEHVIEEQIEKQKTEKEEKEVHSHGRTFDLEL